MIDTEQFSCGEVWRGGKCFHHERETGVNSGLDKLRKKRMGTSVGRGGWGEGGVPRKMRTQGVKLSSERVEAFVVIQDH